MKKKVVSKCLAMSTLLSHLVSSLSVNCCLRILWVVNISLLYVSRSVIKFDKFMVVSLWKTCLILFWVLLNNGRSEWKYPMFFADTGTFLHIYDMRQKGIAWENPILFGKVFCMILLFDAMIVLHLIMFVFHLVLCHLKRPGICSQLFIWPCRKAYNEFTSYMA